MRIGIDVDDVLYPWFDIAHAVCETAGITNGKVPTQWECHVDYGVTREVWVKVLEDASIDGTLYTGEPFEGAIEALHTLKDAGHSLHIITARGFFSCGEIIRAHTIEWLHRHDVPHDSLTFSKDKTVMRVDAFIDDSWKNVQELTAAGTLTWLMDAPHNQQYDFPRRVHTLSEFVNQVTQGVLVA